MRWQTSAEDADEGGRPPRVRAVGARHAGRSRHREPRGVRRSGGPAERDRSGGGPGPGQVVVDVEVAGVLSIDTVVRSGQAAEIFPAQPPYVPGVGAAGQVSAVGEGADREWVGRRVLADVEDGGYAERVTTALENVIPIPDGVGTWEAMALLHDGAGALSVFDRVDVQPGMTVLVQPAAGGLGSGLVQLAAAAGARVIGAARGAHKLKVVKELGADLVVDYTMPGWIDQIAGVNVVFDGVGGDLGQAVFARVQRGGTYSNYGFAGGGFTEIDRERAALSVTSRPPDVPAERTPG
ncbi:zinc-binding dehydrogenase [Actinomadura sp. 9N407]|uniref:zinc-binding dehydrogenase n=1 Tax=Actinomadura sp. 9N407 TaxID=3375154 RepID=UPI00379CB2D3